VMRRMLVDQARWHSAGKRGDGMPAVPIQEARETAAVDGIPILALDMALHKLVQLDRELARIVELRALGGLTIEEAASVLAVSPSTGKSERRIAKAWLSRDLGLDSRP